MNETNELVTHSAVDIEQALAALRESGRSLTYIDQVRRSWETYAAWARTRAEDEPLMVRLEAYAAHLVSGGNQPQSAGVHLTRLKLILRRLAKQTGDLRLIGDVEIALRATELPRGPRGQKLHRWLSQNEARKLLHAPDRMTLEGVRDLAILSLLLGAGLRRREVAALRWSYFQEREGHMQIVNLRSKGRVRTVVIPRTVWRAIEQWSVAAGLRLPRYKRLPTSSVFVGVDRGKQVSNSFTGQSVSDTVQKYAKVADLAYLDEHGHERLPTAHDLRRTFARTYWESGGDLLCLAKLLGHSSVTTTEKYINAGYEPGRSQPEKYLCYSDALGPAVDGELWFLPSSKPCVVVVGKEGETGRKAVGDA